MIDRKDIKRYKNNLRSEQEAIVLYEKLASAEKNPNLKKVYKKLADTERGHAALWSKKLADAGIKPRTYSPGWRIGIWGWFAKKFGTASILPVLAGIEKGAASGYDGQVEAEKVKMPADERSHAKVFGFLAAGSKGMEGGAIAKLEGRHRGSGGNALRAGVLGANDGLVSVFSLVMGVAGAGVSPKAILITGFAGMLAGALSMALGEWLSVQSSRELYQNQLDIEGKELAEAPKEEMEELTLIYQSKGMDRKSAAKMVKQIMSNKDKALDTLAREELGIDPKELGGSAWVAAGTSFLLFSVGAIIPIFPYLFLQGTTGIIASSAASVVGLFIIGSLITLLTAKNAFVSGMRQVIIGLAAAAVTYGLGRLLGVNIAG